MSKSLKRVRAALEAAGFQTDIRDVGQARTAQEAAASLGCSVAQIANSLVFRGTTSHAAYLFLTSGAARVDLDKAAALAGEPLARADAAFVRDKTGFAIGGVAPIGATQEMRVFFDQGLQKFDRIYAAAGTPRHVFGGAPQEILEISSAQVSDFTSI